MTDKQAAMEQLQELYREKNEHLEKFLEPVTPFEFYREIFPVGTFERKRHYEDAKGNGIAVTIPKEMLGKDSKGRKQKPAEKKEPERKSEGDAGIAVEIKDDGKVLTHVVTDELSELPEVCDTDFTIMSPLSYFGRRRCGKNARYLYALVFD